MKILHYALGFPPFRRGGMTKYCIDMMAQQLKCGHQVGMLWPGRINKYGYKISIKKAKYEEIDGNKVCESYEIINPLPVPLLNGIKDIDAFTQEKDESVFLNFFKHNKTQVIHIHTLMGLPKECITAAKKLDIKVVYTTHDYFGLCSKWGLVYKGKVCSNDDECKKCVECNNTALSLNKIKILQSNMYKYTKESKLIKSLRKKHNEDLYEQSNESNDVTISTTYTEKIINLSEKYKLLRKFYVSIFEQMDVIHFNSSNTKKIYESYFTTNKNSKVISITHGSISDNKKIKKYTEKLNIGYLGPITEHKGFFALKSVCDNLYNDYKDKFELHIFAKYLGNEQYMVIHEPYKYEQLPIVMDSIDVLVVPSLWNETFGFTVLEALSYGVPVILSNKVGSSDLIEEGKSGIVYDDLDELKEILKIIIINKSKLITMNDFVFNEVPIKDIRKHAKEIEEIYTYKEGDV